MSPATLAQEIEKLDETQKNAVALFVRFLAAQPHATPADDASTQEPETPAGRVSLFGALKDKITFISPDFDEPLEDFAEYM